jgi:adenosylcobinamide kinase / adenosylcobinamide-phosphate guanylyltransferase
MPLQKLTLVLGGAASGKSAFAESIVTASGLSRIYVATAQVYDTEMADKVARHRTLRGDGWQTVEEPFDLPGVLGRVRTGHVVLIDCATLWLTNVMLGDHDIPTFEAALLAAIDTCPAPVVVVSNEVGQGIVPDNPLARRFRNAQGGLNRALAGQAGLVVAVMAGLPLVLKGQLP